jgi:hypothetical protein
MKPSVPFTVGNETYTVQHFYTTAGLNLLTEIVGLLGEPMASLIGKLKGMSKGAAKFSDLDISDDDAANAISRFVANLKPETVENLFKRILSHTIINAQGSTSCAEAFDTHFQGRYMHLFKVVWKSLGVQYGDFSSALAGIAKKAEQLRPAVK